MSATLSLLLYVLANQPIDTRKDLHVPTKVKPQSQRMVKAPVHDVIGPAGSMWLYSDTSLRTYVYHFEGTAKQDGKACPNAAVMIRVTTSRGDFIERAMTNDDGSYSIKISVDGNRFEPVDWAMEAHVANGKRVQLIGSRIMMREDLDTTVNSTIDFTNSTVSEHLPS